MKAIVLLAIFAMLIGIGLAVPMLHARPANYAQANQLLAPCPLTTKQLPLDRKDDA